MKRLFLALVLVLFCFSISSGADDDITETVTIDRENQMQKIVITWDDTGGDGISKDLTGLYNGWITVADTNPGTTAPDADYDIAIQNTDGIDIMAGTLVNRHTTTSERVTLSNPAYNLGVLTLVITNQTAASGGTTPNTITLFMYKEKI